MKMSSQAIDLSYDSSNSNDDDDLPDINLQSASSSQDYRQGSKNEANKETHTAKVSKTALREERAMTKQHNKVYKPGECMKHMFIEMHPVLLEAWYCADVSRELSAVGAHLKPSSTICDPCLVLWSRTIVPVLTNTGGVVELSSSKERCDRGLYVCQAEEVATHVEAHTLASHMAMAEDLAGCKLTLVVFGVKDYFKSSGRKTTNSSRKLMTEIELEMAITDLLVSAQVDAVMVNTPNDLALTVVQFTKAIAEAPHKRAKRALDEQADFYMRGDSKKCVAVDKDGNGVSRLWQQLVAVLPLSSLETARALCAQYPTPRALYQSLQSEEGVSAVAEVGVARAAVAGSRARRVGPELARKLATLFTADDGSLLVD